MTAREEPQNSSAKMISKGSSCKVSGSTHPARQEGTNGCSLRTSPGLPSALVSAAYLAG